MKTVIISIVTATTLLTSSYAIEVGKPSAAAATTKEQKYTLKIEELEGIIERIPKQHALFEQELNEAMEVNSEIKEAIDTHLLITSQLSGSNNPNLQRQFNGYMEMRPGNTLKHLKNKIAQLIADVTVKYNQAKRDVDDLDAYNQLLSALRIQLSLVQKGASL